MRSWGVRAERRRTVPAAPAVGLSERFPSRLRTIDPMTLRRLAGIAGLAAPLVLAACSSDDEVSRGLSRHPPEPSPPAASVAAEPVAPPPDRIEGRPPEGPTSRVLSETVVLRVTGMTCPVKCPREVRDLLLAVPGVENVIIDYDRREAICHVRPGTDPQALIEALVPPYAAKLAP